MTHWFLKLKTGSGWNSYFPLLKNAEAEGFEPPLAVLETTVLAIRRCLYEIVRDGCRAEQLPSIGDCRFAIDLPSIAWGIWKHKSIFKEENPGIFAEENLENLKGTPQNETERKRPGGFTGGIYLRFRRLLWIRIRRSPRRIPARAPKLSITTSRICGDLPGEKNWWSSSEAA